MYKFSDIWFVDGPLSISSLCFFDFNSFLDIVMMILLKFWVEITRIMIMCVFVMLDPDIIITNRNVELFILPCCMLITN